MEHGINWYELCLKHWSPLAVRYWQPHDPIIATCQTGRRTYWWTQPITHAQLMHDKICRQLWLCLKAQQRFTRPVHSWTALLCGLGDGGSPVQSWTALLCGLGDGGSPVHSWTALLCGLGDGKTAMKWMEEKMQTVAYTVSGYSVDDPAFYKLLCLSLLINLHCVHKKTPTFVFLHNS